MDRSHLRKFVLRMGIEPLRIRTPDSGNQVTLAVATAEADRIKAARIDAGFSLPSGEKTKTLLHGYGFFYAVLPDPELRPNRIKLGFTTSLETRFATYKTTNPEMKLLKSWPCRQSWETAAIEALTNTEDCKFVAGEVYDYDDLEKAITRGDLFFELLGEK